MAALAARSASAACCDAVAMVSVAGRRTSDRRPSVVALMMTSDCVGSS
jgi:hypothetical protein